MSVNVEAVLQAQVDSFTNSIRDAGRAYEELIKKSEFAGGKMQQIGQKLESAGKMATTYITPAAVAVIGKSVQEYIKLESAMTGVRKTTDLTDEEFADMTKSLREMSKEIPTSTTKLAGLTEVAGQLGIKKDNLLKFTRVMADLAETTNIAGETGAAQLAKFANITGMSQENFDRLGSTIVALGNNFATTEQDVLNMSMRIAGVGSQVGMTEPQIAGLAAAFSSVGIEAQVGGSSVSRVLMDMQIAVETGKGNLKAFADTAGMTGEQFQKAFKEDAAGAFMAFVEGLAKAEEKGTSATVILNQMEYKQSQLLRTMLAAAGATDIFTDALNLGTNAWKKNVALANEAALRYGTMESQLEITKNKLTDSFVGLGESLAPEFLNLANGVGDLVEKFNNLPQPVKNTTAKLLVVSAAAGPVMTVFGKLINPVSNLRIAFEKLPGPIAGSAGHLAVMSTTAAVIIPIVSDLSDRIYGYTDAVKQLRSDQYSLAESYDQMKVRLSTQRDEFRNVMGAVTKVVDSNGKFNISLEEMKKRVAEVNEAFPELGLEIIGENQLNRTWDYIDAMMRVKNTQEGLNQSLAMQAQFEEKIAITKERIKMSSDPAELEKLNGILSTYEAQLQLVSNDVTAYNNLLEDGKAKLAEYGAVITDVGVIALESATQTSEGLSGVVDVVGLKFSTSAEAFSAYLEALDIEYGDFVKQAEETLNSHLEAVHGAIIRQNEVDIAAQTEAWEQNKTTYAAYLANLQTIQAMGTDRISEDFKQYLLGMGVTNSDYLNQIINMTDEELAAYEESWRTSANAARMAAEFELQQMTGLSSYAKEFVDGVVAEISVGAEEVGVKADDLRAAIILALSELPNDGSVTGKNLNEYLAEAITANLSLPEDSATGLKNSITRILGDMAKESKAEAEKVPGGAKQALDEGKEDVVKSADDIGNEIIKSARETSEEIKKPASDIAGNTIKEVEGRKLDMYEAAKAFGLKGVEGLNSTNSEAANAANTYAQTMLNTLSSRQGDFYAVGSSLGTSIDAGTRSALAIHSPSKVGIDTARNYAYSIIDNLMASIPRLEDVAGKMGEAVQIDLSSNMKNIRDMITPISIKSDTTNAYEPTDGNRPSRVGAPIVLQLGKREYAAFVEDLFGENDQKVRLEDAYAL